MSNQTKYAYELSSRLPARNLYVSAELHSTRYNGEPSEVDRLYLNLTGTPDAFRYLANLLTELANNADASVVLDPADLKHLILADWSALEITCRTDLSEYKNDTN